MPLNKDELDQLQKYFEPEAPDGQRWEWRSVGGEIVGELVEIGEDDDRPPRGRIPGTDYRFGRRRLG